MDTGERSFLGCSQDVFSPHGNEDFCTRDNWQTAVLYLAQEMEVFGLASPCTKQEAGGTLEASAGGQASLDVITLVNSSWRLIQMYRQVQRRHEDMETATRRAASDRERLLSTAVKQREEMEQRERMIAEAREQERQAGEAVEAGNLRLKAAKEEIRKLMSVLMQREAKYSHEIRRAEQEAAKLKERLVKVLMEKGEGRGAGVSTAVSMTGPVPGGRGGGRAQWNTEHSASRREEELVKRVMEEMSKREAAAAEINKNVETALSDLSAAVREALIDLEVDPHNVSRCGSNLSTRSESLLQQTGNLITVLRENVKKMRKPSEVSLSNEKMSLYEEKLALYEQIIVNFESSKEKQDWISQELKNLKRVSKESLLQERCQLYVSQEQIERMKLELSDEYSKFEDLKAEFIKESHSIDEKLASPIILTSAASHNPCSEPGLPSWALGPVKITPSTGARPQNTPGSGTVLGYSDRGHSGRSGGSRPVSRPGSRPGSQPGSRAQSVHRERLEKGKSPSAAIISKRSGAASGGGGRMLDTYTASLGRKARPKSATISPSRPASSVNRRSQALSRSPSRSKDPVTRREKEPSSALGSGSRASMSLPRHAHHQLSLKAGQDKIKRNSGAWSKPPTPGPLSPANSDSEASGYNYRPGLPKSSML